MKKNVKKAGRTVLCATLILGLVLGNSSFAEAKKVSKKESVYVTAGADGTVQKITVADWLKGSGNAQGTLKDSSNLSEITNVKGDETFNQSGKDINWALAGQDIYYQGQSGEKLPVSMKITYTLDGQEMTAQEMLGKSGKAAIHIEYSNLSKTKKKVNGEMVDIYTPFIMVTGMILSSDIFKDVEIDNGKVINDGSNNIVIGVGTPGLKESLALDEEYSDNLTSDFTITANVTDFEMSNTFTYGSPSLLDELNIDEIGDLDELDDKMDSLTDAAGELLDGTGTLSGNMKTFADKMGELKSSVRTFRKSGVKKLTKGINTLDKGGKKLKKGVKAYTDGVVTFAKGSKSYVAGAGKIAKGNSALYDAVKGMPEQLNEFGAGLTTYTGAVDTLGKEENVTKLKAGANAVSSGITSVHSALKQLKETYDNNEKLINGLKATLALIPDGEEYAAVKTKQTELLGQLEALAAGQKQAIEQMEATTGTDGELKAGADAVAASVTTVMDSLKTLASKSSSLTDASKKLSGSMPELVKNVKALRDGGVTLTKNDKKLISGAKTLMKTSKTMNKSVKKLGSGIRTLRKGGQSLDKASVKLVRGVIKLDNASGKLSDGAGELDDGMSKFNRKGIKKINNLYEDDVQNALDRLDAIIKAGKEYKSFSGLQSSMDGEVKFVIETEPVKKED